MAFALWALVGEPVVEVHRRRRSMKISAQIKRDHTNVIWSVGASPRIARIARIATSNHCGNQTRPLNGVRSGMVRVLHPRSYEHGLVWLLCFSEWGARTGVSAVVGVGSRICDLVRRVSAVHTVHQRRLAFCTEVGRTAVRPVRPVRRRR
jgi:hypothetical protein